MGAVGGSWLYCREAQRHLGAQSIQPISVATTRLFNSQLLELLNFPPPNPSIFSSSSHDNHLLSSPSNPFVGHKMRPVPASAGSALRTWTRHSLPTSSSTSSSSSSRLAAAGITASNVPQRRSQTGAASGSSSFESPFGKKTAYDTHQIPSFKTYASKNSEITNRVFQYFMAGSMGLLAAAGAKNTVQGKRGPEQEIWNEQKGRKGACTIYGEYSIDPGANPLFPRTQTS